MSPEPGNSQNPATPKNLVVALSSRALFNLAESHEIFEAEGETAYREYQIEKENEILEPGFAFPLVKKLATLDSRLKQLSKEKKIDESLGIEVILLSRNTADTGLRVFNSIEKHGLPISRAAFCGGEKPHRYLHSFGCDLFLSAEPEDVADALREGTAAAQLVSGHDVGQKSSETPLRFAFDADSVVFSEESEKIFRQQGLQAFQKNEKRAAATPLPGGPFRGFLEELAKIQKHLNRHSSEYRKGLLQTALFTARDAPAHKRVIRTLREWDIQVDEVLFLGGQAKGSFLQKYRADIFFDDNHGHCLSADDHRVTAGHVPTEIKTG